MNPPVANTSEKPATRDDLEVKDAQLIFSSVWKVLEAEYGIENLRFPKELILLGGAPGAGKGTNTDYIREVRDISAAPIVVSELLDTPEAKAIKAEGGMVGDREVVYLVFRKLLEDEFQAGAILDGFPRTKVQVECLKMLIAVRRPNCPRVVRGFRFASFRSSLFGSISIFSRKQVRFG